jgi:hypothetical protein
LVSSAVNQPPEPYELTPDGGRTWSYQSDARLADAQFGVRLAAGRAW